MHKNFYGIQCIALDVMRFETKITSNISVGMIIIIFVVLDNYGQSATYYLAVVCNYDLTSWKPVDQSLDRLFLPMLAAQIDVSFDHRFFQRLIIFHRQISNFYNR